MTSIGRRMAKGAAWMLGFKLAHRTLTLISTVVLARLLIPADFGLVAMVTAFVAALTLMSAFSFDIILIQHPDPQRSHYNTVWTLQAIIGLLIAALMLGFATTIADFYEEPRLISIFVVLAVGTILSNLNNVGVVDFRKNLLFDRDFLFMFAPRLVGFCITLPLAYYLRSYWALVIGTVAANLAGLVASFVLSPYRPSLSLAARRELFHVSKWLFLNNILIFLRSRAADFIIGKISGPASLGVYTVANEISQIPTTELVAPINRAVLPGFAKLSRNLAGLRKGFLDVIGLIALFALPAATGIAATSELLVTVVLGQKWMAAAPLIAVLGIAGAMQTLVSNVAVVFLALGKPYVVTALSSLSAALLIPMLIYFTSRHGPIGAANAILLTAVIGLPIYLGTLCRALELNVLELCGTIWRPLVAAVAVYAVVNAYTANISIPLESIAAMPQLLIAISIGIVTYTTVISVLWIASSKPNGAESHVLNEITTRVGKFRSRKQ